MLFDVDRVESAVSLSAWYTAVTHASIVLSCYVQVPFVVVAHLENCRLERTACLNEILLEMGEDVVETLGG